MTNENSAETLVRYCPGCGSVGPVEGEHHDCCPDGNDARMIPAALAKKCRDTFKIAVRGLLADRQQRASIPYPLSCLDAAGRAWHPYEVQFRSPDGTYACHLYAISEDHALLQLQALRESGQIAGRTAGAYDA